MEQQIEHFFTVLYEGGPSKSGRLLEYSIHNDWRKRLLLYLFPIHLTGVITDGLHPKLEFK